jgi:hypothetical protein
MERIKGVDLLVVLTGHIRMVLIKLLTGKLDSIG